MKNWTVEDILAEERGSFERVKLSDEFYERLGMTNETLKVPFPMRHEDVQALKQKQEIPASRIIDNLVFACSDTSFDSIYSAYIYCLTRMFGDNLAKALIDAGDAYAKRGDYIRAAIVFDAMKRIMLYIGEHSEQGPDITYEEFERFQLRIAQEVLTAKFRFAMALHVEYNRIAESLRDDPEDEEEKAEKIRVLKAEVLENLELITNEDPNFYPAYYPLGYAYWNLGQYTKASLCFKKYVELVDEIADDPNRAEDVDRKDIGKQYEFAKENIDELADLVEVEQAINDVLRGAFIGGLDVLQKHEKEESFQKWWPIHFYIAFAQEHLGNIDAAIFGYLKVLRLNASHIASMEGLIRCYENIGDDEKVEKYRTKIGLVKENEGISED